jgi:hypothetical protein
MRTRQRFNVFLNQCLKTETRLLLGYLSAFQNHYPKYSSPYENVCFTMSIAITQFRLSGGNSHSPEILVTFTIHNGDQCF